MREPSGSVKVNQERCAAVTEQRSAFRPQDCNGFPGPETLIADSNLRRRGSHWQVIICEAGLGLETRNHPLTVDFLDALRRSELLSAEDMTALVRDERISEETDPRDIARAFVKRGQLTLFQANQLLHGQTRGFFIGGYKLRELLGIGGMGCVYIAEPRDGQGDQPVVIKVLSDRSKHDPGLRARFELEARAGLQLRHENIVQTLRSGLTDDLYGEVPFIVMELVEGINLYEWMRQRQATIPWQLAADCIQQAAEGLHYAHRQGMVHRDIKPTNLLITREGRVKILDFGLALLQNEDQSEFSLAMIFDHQGLGTVDYMAPEQTVNSHAVDGRADIYSLGCTLYYLLSGSAPFPLEKTSQKIEAHRGAVFPAIREKVPNVPEEMARVLARMVMKAPEERFQSAAEVSQALAPFAKRREVEFDFAEILKIRASEARKLLQASSRSNTSSAARKPSGISLSSRPQALVDTRVRTDTAPRNSGIRMPAPPAAAMTPLPGFNSPELQAETPHLRSVDDARLMLVPVHGGAPLLLDREQLVIGRAPGSAIHLDSPSVSSRHAQLSLDGQWWRITDLNSRNGLKVNGVATKDQLLWPGDRISIAEQFQFVLTEIPRTKKGLPWWPFVLAGLVLIAAAVGGYWVLYESGSVWLGSGLAPGPQAPVLE